MQPTITNNGIVYVLTNPAMPGLVKVGMTLREDVAVRMSELYSTGIPVPFECAYAARVNNAEHVETSIHMAFAPYRINPNREFFEINADQAIAMLKLVALEDVTPQVKNSIDQIDEASRKAGDRLSKRRRPSLNFLQMGIPVGATLVAVEGNETAEVASERTVVFQAEEMSLTRATQIILGIDYAVGPTPYWTFNGKNLGDIYEETYPTPE